MRASLRQFKSAMSREDCYYNSFHRNAEYYLKYFAAEFDFFQKKWSNRPDRKNTDYLNAMIRFLEDFGYERGPQVNAILF